MLTDSLQQISMQLCRPGINNTTPGNLDSSLSRVVKDLVKDMNYTLMLFSSYNVRIREEYTA